MARAYNIVAKLDAAEVALESGIATEACAMQRAEEYATGKKSVYTDHPGNSGQALKIFYPTYRIKAVLVIPIDKEDA